MKINIISVGKIKEQYFIDGIEEYKKRISKYANIELITVMDESNDLDDKTILEDAQKCRENIKTICFASEDKFSKKTVAGHIIISRKIVEINADCFKKNFNFNAIYETLTHEIYHGIGAKKTEKGVLYTGLQD